MTRQGWQVDGRVASIMQPYFLPYIGYFQLMRVADVFVVFDDVNFIRRGWIHRNQILVNGKIFPFTIPLTGASQNRRICELRLVEDDLWRVKLARTVHQAYRRAPCYAPVAALFDRLLGHPEKTLDGFILNSLRVLIEHMGLDIQVVASSRVYGNEELKGSSRIIDICRREGATAYVNPSGGIALYDKQDFALAGLDLRFVRARLTGYDQGGIAHLPGLSILDVLMFNNRDQIQRMLDEYDLI